MTEATEKLAVGSRAGQTYSDRSQTAYFGLSCDTLVRNGWAIFPQTIDRRPAILFDRTIKPMEDHGLDDRLPALRDVGIWKRHLPDLNVGCMMGPGSSGALAIDVDVTDRDLSRRIRQIATSILGPTPLIRVGREPKFAMIYRNVPAGQRQVRNMKISAELGGHGIDVLASVKALTFFGTHHGTGRPFRWIGEADPMDIRSSDLPVITPDAVETLLAEIEQFMPFAQTVQGAMTWMVPGWTEGADGKISDGREKFLYDLVVDTVRDAAGQRLDFTMEATVRGVAQTVLETFSRHAVLDGRWTGANLGNEIFSRVRRVCEQAAQGRFDNIRTPRVIITRNRVTRPQAGRNVASDPLMLNEDDASPEPPRGDLPDTAAAAQTPADAKDARAASGNDVGALERAGEMMSATITAFLDQVSRRHGLLPQHEDGQVDPAIRIIKAPPGLGKTSRTLRGIADDPNTYEDLNDPDEGRIRAPYIMLVPTYRNVDELRTRSIMFGLDAAAADEELVAAAREAGLISEADVEDRIAATLRDIRQYAGPGQEHGGFRVGVYQGRVRAGCLMAEQMEAATKGGAGASSLCKTKERNRATGAITEVSCQHYDTCPAILQREMFHAVHLVLMPHAFTALSIPNEAKKARGIIIDERVFDLFVHSTQIPVDTLHLPRRPPRPTRREQSVEDFDLTAWQEGLADHRRHAVGIVEEAFRERRDPAEAFAAMPESQSTAMIHACRRLCSASMQRSSSLRPNMSLDEVQKVVAAPTGHHAREEWRFWTILSERIVGLREETAPVVPGMAGDARIQILHNATTGDRRIRLSWRTLPNWQGTPLLMIDASAAPAIIAKVWGVDPEQVQVTDLVEISGLYDRLHSIMLAPGSTKEAPLPRTFSNTSLLGTKEATPARIWSAKLLGDVRDVLSAIAARHADGRVLVGATIAVRRAITESWASPDNIDWGHFGALRGIDAYKNHVAAVSIGRLELPVDVLDGLAAALAYDDDEPEMPLDREGTGYSDGVPIRMPVVQKTIAMRGGEAKLGVPVHPGSWGALIQAQYREEELLQFLGRLRAFYRPVKPTWYAISSIVPDGTILDDLTTFGAIIQTIGLGAAEMARRSGGRMSAEAIRGADPFWPAGDIERAVAWIEEIARLPGRRWVRDTESLVAGFRQNAVRPPDDKIDTLLGPRESRARREHEVMVRLINTVYRKEGGTIGKDARCRMIDPPGWEAQRRLDRSIPRLSLSGCVALAGLGLYHAGTAARLDPRKETSAETRNFDHYGEGSNDAHA